MKQKIAALVAVLVICTFAVCSAKSKPLDVYAFGSGIYDYYVNDASIDWFWRNGSSYWNTEPGSYGRCFVKKVDRNTKKVVAVDKWVYLYKNHSERWCVSIDGTKNYKNIFTVTGGTSVFNIMTSQKKYRERHSLYVDPQTKEVN